jgi:hypothetical protein
MAKVSGGCFSLKASGQLGKAIVFGSWKGINTVRTHVIPSNPNSQAQQDQRGYLGDAITEWKAVAYPTEDKTAWNRYANVFASAMSGFNAFCKSFIDEAILANTWTRMATVLITVIADDGAQINVTKVSGGDAPNVNWGMSPTNMSTVEAMSDNTGNDWEATLAACPANTKIYFYISVGTSASDYGRTGIFTFTTLP